ncbi:M61 family metallopeptidase [Mitsuaria sp. WAJ17]|uniref:M61 family metallopeptidase n=1 Tax=Mitsuaria sp. WAJ17 TaxID=2761452 RepID=UPI0015FF8D11|nr:PDZ domain-containing protein [Mitsuaria sp. WAJ17]MBB2486652.1 M61 family metallopeptidase [Mitsuaria sp. WAJ17]
MIHYRVSTAAPHTHLYDVQLTVPAPGASQRLSLPVWIPGSYMVREFSRHLGPITARQGRRELPVRQLSKNEWQVDGLGKGPLVLSYQAYAFDTSVRCAFLDAQRGFFNAGSLCLQVEGAQDQPHQIQLADLPRAWQVATAMPAAGGARARHLYQAADYDELLDHPFELGTFWRGEFQARGVPHEFVVAGALPIFDGERLLRDAQRICEAQIDFWHAQGRKREAPPFGRYVFLLNATEDGYGGLEHRASTALIAARRDLPRLGQAETSDGYVRLLGLISHEYFHTWNVKRLRPRDFARFDYAQENYTELLWFFEGFTSYYDDLFLVRAGLIEEARYLKLLTGNVNTVLSGPGRLRQSVAQSSFEAWTKYYRQDENSPNSIVSYYVKGSLLALCLDLSLRAGGSKGASLDALMRKLWRETPERLLDEAQVLAAVEFLGTAELAAQLKDWIHGCKDLPLAPLLEKFGVQWSADKLGTAQRLGLRVNEAQGVLSVRQVFSGGAAEAAGLQAGDELIACNGWRLRKLDDALLSLDPKAPQRLELWVGREQRVLTLPLRLPLDRPAGAPVLLSLTDKAPARLQSLRRAWLHGG